MKCERFEAIFSIFVIESHYINDSSHLKGRLIEAVFRPLPSLLQIFSIKNKFYYIC